MLFCYLYCVLATVEPGDNWIGETFRHSRYMDPVPGWELVIESTCFINKTPTQIQTLFLYIFVEIWNRIFFLFIYLFIYLFIHVLISSLNRCLFYLDHCRCLCGWLMKACPKKAFSISLTILVNASTKQVSSQTSMCGNRSTIW